MFYFMQIEAKQQVKKNDKFTVIHNISKDDV